MALSTDQLKHLSRLYDVWQSGDAAARDAVQREIDAAGADIVRAFAQMVAHAYTEASALLLPPISQALRDAAVLAAGQSNAGSATSANSTGFGATLSDTGDMPTREPNQHVGPYRLIKELGRGGMGVVWLAERADGQHSRQVALKMPLVENLNWLLAARFARERNILASLEHPSIARLYDAGVDQADRNAQPYIAIEYVQGVPITDFVRAKKLKPEGTAQLFIRVIEAVAHAHTQLVIHRDIKPSNILVDAKGEPHLLDFGIAKLLDDEDSKTADATQLTRLSGRALTLDYASPEQVNNASLGTASDVYSLGIVLYELLTGGRPYRPKGPTRRDLEQAILDQEPSKPSDQLLTTNTGDSESGKSARRMRGDLDTVVLKALRKDPKLRYATAQAFADDLKRYLAYEPIAAKPDSHGYRLRRWIRRHRLVATMGTLIALCLTVTTVVTTLHMREAQRQREEANFRAEQASHGTDFLFGLLDEISTSRAPLAPLALMHRARQTLESRFAGDPRFAATMLSTLASRYDHLGQLGADADLRARAIALARQQPDPSVLAQVVCEAVTHDIRAGRLELAAAQLQEAQTLLQTTLGSRVEPQFACLRGRALLAEWRNDHAGAIVQMQAAVDYLDRAGDSRSMRYVGALHDLGHFLASSDRPQESIDTIQKAGRILDETGRSHTIARIQNLQTEAFALDRMGELQSAAKLEVIAMSRLQGEDISVPRVESAYQAMEFGVTRYKLADPAALVWFEYAAKKWQDDGEKNGEMQARTWLALAQITSQQWSQAEANLDAAMRWFASHPHQRFFDRARLAQTKLLLVQGQVAAAKQQNDQMLAEAGYPAQKSAGPLSGLLTNAAALALARGDGAEARQYAVDLLAIANGLARDPLHSASVGGAQLLLAKAYLQLKQRSAAIDALRQALPGLAYGLGEAHPSHREAQQLLASVD